MHRASTVSPDHRSSPIRARCAVYTWWACAQSADACNGLPSACGAHLHFVWTHTMPQCGCVAKQPARPAVCRGMHSVHSGVGLTQCGAFAGVVDWISEDVVCVIRSMCTYIDIPGNHWIVEDEIKIDSKDEIKIRSSAASIRMDLGSLRVFCRTHVPRVGAVFIW